MSWLPLLIAAVGLTAAAAGLAAWRIFRLPLPPWWEQAGAIWLEDGDARRRAYEEARARFDRTTDSDKFTRSELESFAGTGAADLGVELVRVLTDSRTHATAVLGARERGLRRLTVVLFGRTKAGKSSVFSASTGKGFDGIGNGRQNKTTENHRHVLRNVELIDSPGISGIGSRPLESETEAALQEADVVVVQVTEDRLSAEDLARIDAIAMPPRAVVLAVNVKAASLDRLVQKPERVFREDDLRAHIGRLRRGLPSFKDRDLAAVAYHAYGAAEARRGRWRRDRQKLWASSRIDELHKAVMNAAPEAARLSLGAPTSVVAAAANSVVVAVNEAAEVATARREGEERSLAQVVGILREVRESRSEGLSAIVAHFAEAESGLINALSADDRRSFKSQSDKALDLKGLSARLETLLERSRSEIKEKLEDLTAELQVLDIELDNSADDLQAAWTRGQVERQRAVDAKRRNRRRKITRGVMKAAILGAAAIASGLSAGSAAAVGVVAAEAGDRLADALFPDVDVPGPTSKVAQVRATAARAAKAAEDAYIRILDEVLLAPAEAELVPPREAAIADLVRFEAVMTTLAAKWKTEKEEQ